MRRTYYRPAYTKPISTSEEKDRYNQICSYHGGKGLPQELTQPEGEAPYEVQLKKKEADRLAKLRAKYRKDTANVSEAAPLSNKEMLLNDISNEIQERCD